MKPQPQGHTLDDPYNQEVIKPDTVLGNKARSPSKYQDGYNTSYSEKEALKQLPEASSWPKFPGTGEYYHMDVIDLPSIPDYWITARLNTAFKGHASIWHTDMKEIHGGRVIFSKSTSIVLGYGKRPCHLKMTSTLWKRIHISSGLDSLKDLKPLILK
ncbi:hypothetical protein O181_009352 [Austropuccinia psidii MF-1]|uniref:Uncharacterized protein n=1 Tax=Austropuccinia psidii MF-1 TaxID=1389203 RepID=A0A9Q3BRL7_9BASI|nr:hypothetical protein [Austropuccinia psidii MF-1]